MQSLLFLASALIGLGFVSAAPSGSRDVLVRQVTSDTSNQLTDGTACRAVTVIYARGTTETGNLGLLGPVFLNDLASAVGNSNLAVQGVNYAADIPGFLAGGDPTGSALMAQLAAQVC